MIALFFLVFGPMGRPHKSRKLPVTYSPKLGTVGETVAA